MLEWSALSDLTWLLGDTDLVRLATTPPAVVARGARASVPFPQTVASVGAKGTQPEKNAGYMKLYKCDVREGGWDVIL
ncbi:unnamed protein product, partial [Iphiclides podalirius]